MITITLDAGKLKNRLDIIGNPAKGIKKSLKEVGEYMVNSIRQNMYEGGRPNKWDDLTGGGVSRLMQTLKLHNSIKVTELTDTSIHIGSTDNERKVSALRFGAISPSSTERYRAIMGNLRRQGRFIDNYKEFTKNVKGTKRRKNHTIKLPAREFMKFQREAGSDIENIKQILIKYITQE